MSLISCSGDSDAKQEVQGKAEAGPRAGHQGLRQQHQQEEKGVHKV